MTQPVFVVGIFLLFNFAAENIFRCSADGEEFPIEASISHATVDGKKLYTILRNITEREVPATELAQSNQRLREHQVWGERTRIARELHDELAQWLTALKMDAPASGDIDARAPRDSHLPHGAGGADECLTG